MGIGDAVGVQQPARRFIWESRMVMFLNVILYKSGCCNQSCFCRTHLPYKIKRCLVIPALFARGIQSQCFRGAVLATSRHVTGVSGPFGSIMETMQGCCSICASWLAYHLSMQGVAVAHDDVLTSNHVIGKERLCWHCS
jgi:hypothetical protein